MTNRNWYQPRRAFVTLAAVVGGLCAVLALVLRVAMNSVSIPPSGTSVVADYPTVLSQWSSTGLVTHFPATIPAGATSVRFSSEPGFLQGGAHIWIRFRLPPDEVAAIEAKAKGATTRSYGPGDRTNLPATMADQIGTINTASLAESTLYILNATDRGSGTWNHGQMAGIAVSHETNEVLYWAESW
jgi:hypothetical protein